MTKSWEGKVNPQSKFAPNASQKTYASLVTDRARALFVVRKNGHVSFLWKAGVFFSLFCVKDCVIGYPIFVHLAFKE